MRRAMILAGLMALWPAAGAKPPPDDTVARTRPVVLAQFDAALLGREIFRESNAVRQQLHLPALRAEPRLDASADNQATMMALRLMVDHGNLLRGQGDAMERVESQGLAAQRVLENVAMTIVHPSPDPAEPPPTYAQLAAHIVQQWMDSPEHRANLLSRDVTHLGCAARSGLLPINHEVVFAAQDFVLPRPGP